MSRNLRTPAILLLLLTPAAWLRLWRIADLPPGFHFDEAFEGLEAWRILHEDGYLPVFLTGNFGVPPLNAYANAAGFALADMLGGEAGPTAMRIVAAVFGVLGVLAVFGLGNELRRLDAGPRRLSAAFPLLAAASLAVMRWHIHFSRMGIEPVMVPLIWAGAVWLLLAGWRTGRWAAFVLAGAVTAAGMYAYQGAWIIPFLMAAYALLLLLRAYRTGDAALPLHRRRWTGLLVAGGVALTLFAPLGWFFWQHPDLLWMRPAQLAIVGETNSPADNSVGRSLWDTVTMFVPFGASGDLDPRRNLPGAPVLNLWQAIPFGIGLVVAAWRIRRTANAIVLAGLAGLLLPGVVSEYAPHFHRVLGAAAPVALLCGIGLDWLHGRIAALPRLAPRMTQAVAAGAVCLLLIAGAAVSARDYFVRWAALPDLFYAFDAGLWKLGQQTYAFSGEPLYITPRGAEHATLAFAWRARDGLPPAQPVSFDGRHIFPLSAGVTSGPERYAVVEHEDFRTRLLLPEVFPAASVDYELADAQGEVYARIYTRPAQVTPQRPPTFARSQDAQEVGDGIRLAGYDVLPDPPRRGEPLYLQLHWLVDAAPAHDWTVFAHVVDPASGQVAAGHDSQPGAGSLPTLRWQPGWRILDERQIPLPAGLPPGEYRLRAGLYRGAGARLPAEGPGIDLGVVIVE